MSQTVPQYVIGETSTSDSGFPSIITPPPVEASAITAEPPLTEPTERAEELDQGALKPTSTAEQRRFSVDWDPIQCVSIAIL